MAIEQRRGKFKLDADAVFSNDPAIDLFFRQIRVYSARMKNNIVHYKAVSTVFDEIPEGQQEPSYDLYMEGGELYAERNDFEQELRK